VNGEWGGATQRDSLVYLHILKWQDGRILLPRIAATIRRSVALTGGIATVTQTAEGTMVTMPPGQGSNLHTIVRLELDRPAGRALTKGEK